MVRPRTSQPLLVLGLLATLVACETSGRFTHLDSAAPGSGTGGSAAQSAKGDGTSSGASQHGPAADGGNGAGASAGGADRPAADGGGASLDDGGLTTAPGAQDDGDTLRVAIFGDEDVNADARAVLQLIKREHVALVIHTGDAGYEATPSQWNAQIDDVLGPDFPYVLAVGNHDVPLWEGANGYQALLKARLARTPQVQCVGDLGVKSTCHLGQLMFVLSGVGSLGDGHEAYLESALSDTAPFQLCVWHKNQHDMQTGDKVDEVGWGAYEICQAHGALIMTGHAHGYARSYGLRDLGNAEKNHGYFGDPNFLDLGLGSTVVVVSALGGRNLRAWNGESNPWWSNVYTKDYQLRDGTKVTTASNIQYGALFVTFHFAARKAVFDFKTTTNEVIDHFEVQLH